MVWVQVFSLTPACACSLSKNSPTLCLHIANLHYQSSDSAWHAQCGSSLPGSTVCVDPLTRPLSLLLLALPVCPMTREWTSLLMHLLLHLPLSVLTGNNLQHSHQRGRTTSPSLNLQPALADLKLHHKIANKYLGLVVTVQNR